MRVGRKRADETQATNQLEDNGSRQAEQRHAHAHTTMAARIAWRLHSGEKRGALGVARLLMVRSGFR